MTLNIRALMSSGAVVDPYFPYVAALLHGDGSNGAQNNTFVDSSANNLTITRYGNATQGSFSPYGSNWSNYFDGTGDFLSVTNSNFAFLTGAWTVEFWIYPLAYGGSVCGAQLFGTTNGSAGGYSIQLGQDINSFRITSNATGSWDDNLSAGTGNGPPLNTWTHMAVVRSGANLSIYKNGVRVATTASAASWNFYGQTAIIGRFSDGANVRDLSGYLSNLRVANTAIYDPTQSTITVSTTPLTAVSGTQLLTCHSNRFQDGSTNNLTFTVNGNTRVTNFAPFTLSAEYKTTTNGGSLYFDGSGDYLTAPASSAWAFGTGDFTVECWINYNSGSPGGRISTRMPGGGSGGTWGFNISPTTFTFTEVIAGEPGVTASGLPNMTGAWTHLAACRSGSTLRLFANGVLVGSGTNTTDFFSTSYPLAVGAGYETSIAGYMAGVRIVKGTALYTAAFTPPTSPVTAVTNTQILLNTTNAAIIDNSTKNNFETVGNVQVSTSVKKVGTGSMYFDGNGDYLTAPNSHVNNLGTGNFTIELWFKSDTGTMNTHACLVASYSSATQGAWAFKAQSSTTGYIEFASYGPSWNDWVTTTNIAADQQWHHCAVTRSEDTLRIFVDGTVVGTWNIAGKEFSGGGHPLTVGFMSQDSTSYINGNIDEVRITKGIARYTANFTPPTRAFPDK